MQKSLWKLGLSVSLILYAFPYFAFFSLNYLLACLFVRKTGQKTANGILRLFFFLLIVFATGKKLLNFGRSGFGY